MTFDEFHSGIAVRTYTVSQPPKARFEKRLSDIGYSDWTLTLDTETTTDEFQNLRFGGFQLRKQGEIRRAGMFIDPTTVTAAELERLEDYCGLRGLELFTVADFLDQIFFPYVYELDALCVGFNLPFDLSRLAIHCAPARGSMRGGFSLKLSKDKNRPRLQIKHIDNGAAIIRFALPPKQNNTRAMRKNRLLVPAQRGYFVDGATLASALLGRSSWSLKSLAKHLRTPSQKYDTEGHGQTVTKMYLDYAIQDVQVTWECFEALRSRYESYCLTKTLVNKIYSAASIGKAYLRQMGIKPFLWKQPAFPPQILGAIMSSYYGGRAEVHIRCDSVQVVLTDFLSMYPTVCILMGLWQSVIAESIAVEDMTADVRDLLSNINLETLQNPEFWKHLNVLVQIQPQADILPVRAPYSRYSHELSIGVNHLTCSKPLWFTLADCIASTLLSGHPPEVIQAMRFVPKRIQENLIPIDICGNPDYHVDPVTDDFYKQLIDWRNDIKAQMNNRRSDKTASLDAEQSALKTCANATSYGIFLELNTREYDRNREVTCYGYDSSFVSHVKTIEEPGRYFHPLLATLITAAARLMLAITEMVAKGQDLDWAFCDTDSMALAKPPTLSESDFFKRVVRVQQWFDPLNPYRHTDKHKESLLKIEDVNYECPVGRKRRAFTTLYCWAVSAKRYALFTLDALGKPVIRKATEHGLGYLYVPKNPSDKSSHLSGVDDSKSSRWHPLWCRIVQAGLDGHHAQVELEDVTILSGPAVSQYTTNNPTLLRWFKKRNLDREYLNQIKPFNFFLVGRPKLDLGALTPNTAAPVAPYDNDLKKSLSKCYDRTTDSPIHPSDLKSCQEALAQFHLHPENKFSNGDYLDTGLTKRRHVVAISIEHIGKESNRLEEQWYTGVVDDAQIHYGYAPSDLDDLIKTFIEAARRFGAGTLARVAGLSVGHVRRILTNKLLSTDKMILKLRSAIRILQE